MTMPQPRVIRSSTPPPALLCILLCLLVGACVPSLAVDTHHGDALSDDEHTVEIGSYDAATFDINPERSVDTSIILNPQLDCEQARNISLVSRQPIGRGFHKEVYIGRYKSGLVVLKMPLYNDVNKDRFDHTLVPHLPDKHQKNLEGFISANLRTFPPQIEEEIEAATALTHGHAGEPNHFIASYLGGCLGMHYGRYQMVVQEGPFITLQQIQADATIFMPWYARFQVAISIASIHEKLSFRHLVHCSWHSAQVGVDSWLRVRLIDLGHIVAHRPGEPRLGSGRTCESDDDCLTKHSDYCIANPRITDNFCDTDTQRCTGVDALSAVQNICKSHFRWLLIFDDKHAWHTPASMQEDSWRLYRKCATEVREERLTSHQLRQELQTLFHKYDGPSLLKENRNLVRDGIQEAILHWQEMAAEDCANNRFC